MSTLSLALNMDGETERAVQSAYAVVYTLQGMEWAVAGEGWAQVQLLQDTVDGAFRIVGWTVADNKVVINANVNASCSYKLKSDDFHKFSDENGASFGFGFYKRDDAIRESKRFMEAVVASIKASSAAQRGPATAVATSDLTQSASPPQAASQLKQLPERKGTVRELVSKLGGGAPAASPTLAATAKLQPEAQEPQMHRSETKVITDIYDRGILPLGQLPILPKRPGVASVAPADRKGITDVFKVHHNHSVKFDKTTGKFEGLPPDWEEKLKQQFGVPPMQLECVQLQYKSRIPVILVRLREYLIANGGLDSEGIFRISPDQEECSLVKVQLNSNTFSKCNDINCVSHLIKVWYRDLPVHVLDAVKPEEIIACDSEQAAQRIISSMAEPYQSLLSWLLDVCKDVLGHKAQNKMSAQALAIVLGPNMFASHAKEAANPLQALEFSQKVAQFLTFAILARDRH